MKKQRHFEHGIIGQTGYGKTFFSKKLLKRFNRVIVADPQYEFPDMLQAQTLKHFINIISGQSVFRVAAAFEQLEQYTNLFRLVYKNIKNVVLLVDEISLFAPTYKSDYWLKQIAQRGRAKNISLIWTTQRPANVSRDITSQALAITAFRLTEIRDISYLSSQWRSKQGEQILTSLPKYKNKLVRGDLHDVKEFYGF